jgi:hypothetical protein
MAGEIGKLLNQTVRRIVAPADIGVDWIAVELESSQSNPIYVDGFAGNFAINAAADLAITGALRFGIFRNLKITDKTLAFGTFLPAVVFDQKYHIESRDAKVQDDFSQSVLLEPGYIYTCVLWLPFSSAAFTQNVHYYLTVRGRIMPNYPVEKMPVELRVGANQDTEMDTLCSNASLSS